MQNRQEHLDWCKKRALEILDQGDITGTLASFMSDMGKHEETAGHVALNLGMVLAFSGNLSTDTEMRSWIEGFN